MWLLKPRDGDPPITYAIYNNHTDAVDLLISRGAYLYGGLILMTNTSYMRNRLIIHYGIDVTPYREDVVEIAVRYDEPDLLRYIKPTLGEMLLMMHTCNHIDRLLGIGIGINERFGHNGDTLLHMCIRSRDTRLIRYLVKKKGADVTICNDIGEIPNKKLTKMISNNHNKSN